MSEASRISRPSQVPVVNIGQAADASGITPKMIRYYEHTGLLKPAPRSTSGYRRYTDTDVQTLRFIKRARDLGFSLERISMLLELWGDASRQSADVKRLANQYIAELDQDIRKLQSMRDQLRHLADCCSGDQRPDCPILDDLAAPGAA